MKYTAIILAMMVLLSFFTIPCLAAGTGSPSTGTPSTTSPTYTGSSVSTGDWSNCLWLSKGLNGDAVFQIGYLFHRDDIQVNVTTTNTSTSGTWFDLSFSNTLLAFDNSGFYGQIGINSSDSVNPFFGAGFSLTTSDWLLMAGAKFYVGKNTLVSEAQIFYKPYNPLVINFGYDSQTSSFHAGLGLVFN